MSISDTYIEAIQIMFAVGHDAGFTVGPGCSLNVRPSVLWAHQSGITQVIFKITGNQTALRMTDCSVAFAGGSENNNYGFLVTPDATGASIQLSNVQFSCQAPAATSEVTIFKLAAPLTGTVSGCQFIVPQANSSRLNILDTTSHDGCTANLPFIGCVFRGAIFSSGNPDSINFELNGGSTVTGGYTAPITGNFFYRTTNFTNCSNAVLSGNIFINSQPLIFIDRPNFSARCIISSNSFNLAPKISNPGMISNNGMLQDVTLPP